MSVEHDFLKSILLIVKALVKETFIFELQRDEKNLWRDQAYEISINDNNGLKKPNRVWYRRFGRT